MMLFMLNEIMIPRKARDRWGITQEALRMKLKSGKIKYYKPEGKQRGEWILTIEAMGLLFPKRKERC